MENIDIDRITNSIEALHFIDLPLELVVAARDAEDLRSYADIYPLTVPNVQILFNTFSFRQIKYSDDVGADTHPVTIEHIIAALGHDHPDINTFVSSFPNIDVDKVMEYMQKEKLIITELIYEYIGTYISRNLIDHRLEDIYIHLRGLFHAGEKLFHPHTIIGAMGEVFSDRFFSPVTLHKRLSELEGPSSRYYISPKRVSEIIAEFKDTASKGLRFNVDIDMLKRIISYPADRKYDLQLEMNRNYIRLTKPLNIIDTVSSVTTTEEFPLIVGVTKSNQPIIKCHHSLTIDFEELVRKLSEMKTDTIIMLMKGRFVHYDKQKNIFTFNDDGNMMITNILWENGITSLTAPVVSNSSYSFITNAITDLDKSILAWLIMNPPEEYDLFRKIIFIKEDLKSISQRKHITIHIQLGSSKMYLTISSHRSTKGTLTRSNGSIAGFVTGQDYFVVKVNRVSSIDYARIAAIIYQMIIDMYMKYHQEALKELATVADVHVNLQPTILPLVERYTTKRDILRLRDRELFKGTTVIEEHYLPDIISRQEVESSIADGYSVMRLPVTISNDQSISINSSRELWIRTPERGKFSIQRIKNKWIPVLYRGRANQPILMIDEGFNVSIARNENYSSQYVLRENSGKVDVGRLAKLPSEIVSNIVSILPDLSDRSIMRLGVSGNIIATMNFIRKSHDVFWTDLTYADVAVHATACKQECWDLSVAAIEAEILSGNVCLHRHWRAIEDAFELNIYMLSGTKFKLPRHNQAYLHRASKKDWNTVIFYSSPGIDDEHSIIVHDKDIFLNVHQEFDAIINSTLLVVHDGKTRVHKLQFDPHIDGYTIVNQIFDTSGKTRAISYRQKDGNVFTLDVGVVAPYSFIPEGEVLEPVIRTSIDETYVLKPSSDAIMKSWSIAERNARILYTTALLLFSASSLPLDDFMKTVIIDEDVIYDTSLLQSEMNDVFEYMRRFNKTMVRDDRLVLNDRALINPIYHYLRISGKREIPHEFPSLIIYSWDIKRSGVERVFLDYLSFIMHIDQKGVTRFSRELIISDYPYVMSRGHRFYNILMSDDERKASYLYYRYHVINRPCNIITPVPASYDGTYEAPFVDSNFESVDVVSRTRILKSTFIIVPM